MQVNLTLTPGYRLKITRASRMSELVDRTITGLAALGGSAAFLEISAAGSSAGRRSARSSSSSTCGSWKRATPYARRPTSASERPAGPRRRAQASSQG